MIAASPDDPALHSLREDLLQLIALEEQASIKQVADAEHVDEQIEKSLEVSTTLSDSAVVTSLPEYLSYMAQGTFTEHIASKEAIAEAPDLAPFQPVMPSTTTKIAVASNATNKCSNGSNGGANASPKSGANEDTRNEPTEKKKKRTKSKKNNDSNILEAKFELPPHLIPLDSDTPAQKLKKQRTAKALKSKFREKQKELEHARRQNDWKSFAGGSGGKRKAIGAAGIGGSIFATEEGVNAKVGVISGGGGGRKMTNVVDQGSKRHKFL